MTAENEREIYHKLEAMKEIRNKTITLERLKRSILNEVRSGDQEGRCLAQYKREMELLQQEKMSHVEELRQIHADINAMETVIKQTEESMGRKLSTASRLHEDYRPLKAEVDLLRRQCLGLDRLPDLHEEEGSPITPDRFPAAPRAFLAPAPRKPPPPPPAFRSALQQDFLTVQLRFDYPFVAPPPHTHAHTHRAGDPTATSERFKFDLVLFRHFLLLLPELSIKVEVPGV
ncbi:zinc finger C4H2 domain-containing protein isoform X1 [Epargyreus clarus]|uniref:zinc finger C4H2 domain-containing protein isoform X1 n=1 Tax=Epargyreus clarus TaxID=520877 RepID=UPI003C2C9888